MCLVVIFVLSKYFRPTLDHVDEFLSSITPLMPGYALELLPEAYFF